MTDHAANGETMSMQDVHEPNAKRGALRELTNRQDIKKARQSLNQRWCAKRDNQPSEPAKRPREEGVERETREEREERERKQSRRRPNGCKHPAKSRKRFKQMCTSLVEQGFGKLFDNCDPKECASINCRRYTVCTSAHHGSAQAPQCQGCWTKSGWTIGTCSMCGDKTMCQKNPPRAEGDMCCGACRH